MAFDFPSSPTVGQTYTSGPASFVWNGYGWEQGSNVITADGDKGDIVVSGGGASWMLDSSVATAAGRAVLDDPDAAAQLTTLGAVGYGTAQSLTTAQQEQARKNVYAAPFDALGYYGLQTNGSAVLNQGAEGFSTAIDTGGYICDGWTGVTAGTANKIDILQQTSGPVGIPGSVFLRAGAAITFAAGGYALLGTNIEGYRWMRLQYGVANAQPVTVAFWVYASITGTAAFVVRNAAANRSYVATFTVNAANTWEYKTITVPGDVTGTWPLDNNWSAYLWFCAGIGTTYAAPTLNTWLGANYLGASGQTNFLATLNNVFYISGLMVLPGNEAPPQARASFIQRPVEQELLLAQRYYWADTNPTWIFADAVSAGPSAAYLMQPVYHPATMRIAPTIGLPTFNLGSVGAVGANGGNPRGFLLQALHNAAAGQRVYFNYASGKLTVSAR